MLIALELIELFEQEGAEHFFVEFWVVENVLSPVRRKNSVHLLLNS